jgi:hypothetical protein
MNTLPSVCITCHVHLHNVSTASFAILKLSQALWHYRHSTAQDSESDLEPHLAEVVRLCARAGGTPSGPSHCALFASLARTSVAMITYSKNHYGFGVLFRIYGSAAPRALPFAIVAVLEAAYLHIHQLDYIRKAWQNPFPYQVFGYIVGFIVVFR